MIRLMMDHGNCRRRSEIATRGDPRGITGASAGAADATAVVARISRGTPPPASRTVGARRSRGGLGFPTTLRREGGDERYPRLRRSPRRRARGLQAPRATTRAPETARARRRARFETAAHRATQRYVRRGRLKTILMPRVERATPCHIRGHSISVGTIRELASGGEHEARSTRSGGPQG